MEYLANVLPVDPKFWTLSKATMTKDLIKIEAGGTASTTLTHDQVQFTPKAFKVTVKFLGEFDEFSPAAFAKLLIKDKDKKYQVFTAPFQVTSKTSNAYYMQAELITNVADFNTLIFQFNTEEYVEITEWKLYPSSDIDTNTLNTIESMLPQFLSTFNEKAITIGTNETEIVNLPFAMGEAGNLSCHLLFSYVVEASCKMIVTIKVDGSAEPYTPIVMQVQEGPGFVGIPHSFLQVQAAAHLISVTVKLEAYENQPSFNVTGSISLPVTGTFTGTFADPVEGTTEELSGSLNGTASGNASMTATRSSAGQLKASIQPKAVRYTCEGRGILNGQSGEYPHAEVSETYDEYPIINIGRIQCSTTCEVTTSDYTNIDNIERYTYPTVSLDELGYTADIPIAAVKAFGATERWVYDSSKADMIHITGNVVLTSTGLTFENGVGEGIVTYDALYPTEDYDPLINCVDFTASGAPNIRFAFSTDGSNWFVTDETSTWQAINLTMPEMSSRGIIPAQLATLDSNVFKALFERGGAKKLTIAVYMVSSIQQTSFTLNNIVVYYSTDESNLPLLAPVITFAIAEDSKARVHWQVPTGQPRAIKLYYGESVDFGQTLQSDVGATFCEVPDLSNRTKYYFAAATLGYGRESELSNIMSVVPTTPVPRFLVCEADISKITLQWQTVGAVYDSYNVYLGTSEDNLVLHTNTTEMQTVIENLQNNVEYFVALTGVKPDEESWFSEIRTARPLLPILSIQSITAGRKEVRIVASLPDKYKDYDGFVSYKVYYGTSPQELDTVLTFSSLDITISGLSTDVQYFFYVTGCTDTEESTPSDMVSAATDPYSADVYEEECTLSTSPAGDFTCPSNFVIGAVSTRGTIDTRRFTGVLHRVLIYTGDKIEHYYLPATLNGASGLLDTVTGSFITPTEGITCVVDEPIGVKLIEGTQYDIFDGIYLDGIAYFTTPYTPSSDTRVEAEFTTGTFKECALFGSRASLDEKKFVCFLLKQTIMNYQFNTSFVSCDVPNYDAKRILIKLKKGLFSYTKGLRKQTSTAFTTLYNTGPTKPLQSTADVIYPFMVEVTQGIQKYIIPETGRYQIVATGAAGGSGGGSSTNNSCKGGFGAIIGGEFDLVANDELYLLVGQKGTDNPQVASDATTGGGGGMSVVAIKDDTQTDKLFGTIPVRPLIVAGAGNGGGDAAYSGTPGNDALLDEGNSDAFLSKDYSGGGYRQYRNNSYCGKSFLVGGDAASYYYTRNGNGSYAGFGGGGSNKDNGAGGGGGGYRGGVLGSHGGSSYNAGENPTATLNTKRTDGLIKIKLIGGTE